METATLIVPVDNELHLQTENGQVVVSSRYVAERFGKNHKEVLRAIENHISTLGGAQNCADLFIENQYQHPQNKQWYKEYLLTRDGFGFAVMGFTGEEAATWKLAYIKAFNKMEQALREQVPLLEYNQELQEFDRIAKALRLGKKDKLIAAISILQKHQMPTLGLEHILAGQDIKVISCNPETRKQAVDYITNINPEGRAITEYYQAYTLHCVRGGIENIGRITLSNLIKELGYKSKSKRINGEVRKAWTRTGGN